jgi:hypothetical protein
MYVRRQSSTPRFVVDRSNSSLGCRAIGSCTGNRIDDRDDRQTSPPLLRARRV